MSTANTEKKNNVKGYRIDYPANTVYLTYKFAAAAGRDFNSAEAMLLLEIQTAFPTIKVVVKAGRNITKTRKTKNLSYKNMEKYLTTLKDSEKLLKQFEIVKEKSKSNTSPYKYVREWFEATCPDYKNAKSVFEDEKKENNTKGNGIDTQSQNSDIPEKNVA